MTCYRIAEPQHDSHYDGAYEQMETLIGELRAPGAHRCSHGEAEDRIWKGGMELMRRLMQGYLDDRSSAEDAKVRVVGGDGEAAGRSLPRHLPDQAQRHHHQRAQHHWHHALTPSSHLREWCEAGIELAMMSA